MLPLLELSADGQDHSLGEALEAVASRFGTTAEERQQLLPSGRQTTLYSRV
ncbi:MAG: winged helix-turn-helix domain-containing protein, partial [Deltaproteobacteria bacterium]